MTNKLGQIKDYITAWISSSSKKSNQTPHRAHSAHPWLPNEKPKYWQMWYLRCTFNGCAHFGWMPSLRCWNTSLSASKLKGRRPYCFMQDIWKISIFYRRSIIQIFDNNWHIRQVVKKKCTVWYFAPLTNSKICVLKMYWSCMVMTHLVTQELEKIHSRRYSLVGW